MCYGIVFFKFPITESSLSFVGLVEFWFGLILNFFGNKNLSLFKNIIYMAIILNMPTDVSHKISRLDDAD